MRVVQAFAREETNLRFDVVNRGNLQANLLLRLRAVTISQSAPSPRGGDLVRGPARAAGVMTVGSLYAFLAYVGRFFEPINDLSSKYNSMQAWPAGSGCSSCWTPRRRCRTARGRRPARPSRARSSSRTSSFEYVPDRPSCGGSPCTPVPGQLVALVGHSGAGKTTTTYLIPRFYDPTSGRITLDGHDLRDLTLDCLASQFGVVTQESFLFHDTLRANLLYARPDATEADLIAACHAANIHDLITTLPEGYDTVVGERGFRLSGGAEAARQHRPGHPQGPPGADPGRSHLLPGLHSEALIQEALAPLMRGRTSVVIAHRLSTILAADQILVFAGGQVAERGTHAELLAQGGVYADLYRIQFAGQEALQARIDDLAAAVTPGGDFSRGGGGRCGTVRGTGESLQGHLPAALDVALQDGDGPRGSRRSKASTIAWCSRSPSSARRRPRRAWRVTKETAWVCTAAWRCRPSRKRLHDERLHAPEARRRPLRTQPRPPHLRNPRRSPRLRGRPQRAVMPILLPLVGRSDSAEGRAGWGAKASSTHSTLSAPSISRRTKARELFPLLALRLLRRAPP